MCCTGYLARPFLNQRQFCSGLADIRSDFVLTLVLLMNAQVF